MPDPSKTANTPYNSTIVRRRQYLWLQARKLSPTSSGDYLSQSLGPTPSEGRGPPTPPLTAQCPYRIIQVHDGDLALCITMKEVDLGTHMLALRYLIPRYLILATYTCLARYKNRREAVIEALSAGPANAGLA